MHLFEFGRRATSLSTQESPFEKKNCFLYSDGGYDALVYGVVLYDVGSGGKVP